jgi:hypothetical protein
MGIVFGITGSKEPMFQSIKTAPFEIRLVRDVLSCELGHIMRSMHCANALLDFDAEWLVLMPYPT